MKNGPRKGLRTLPEVEDAARDLIKSLDAEQKKAAHQDQAVPGDRGEHAGRQASASRSAWRRPR